MPISKRSAEVRKQRRPGKRFSQFHFFWQRWRQPIRFARYWALDYV
jgi:hypothetical protein